MNLAGRPLPKSYPFRGGDVAVVVAGCADLFEQAQAALPQSRFRVDGSTIEELGKRLASESADVVLLELEDAAALAATIAALRRSANGLVHVIAVVESGDISVAVDAGVDDFLRKPISGPELLARVDGVRHRPRIRPLALAWDGALPGLEDFSDTFLDTVVGFAGGTFVLEPGEASPTASASVACVTLNIVSDGVAVHVWLLLEPASLQALASRLLGVDSSPHSVLEDLTNELANLAAGTLMRTCPTSNYITMGLPRYLTPESFASVSPTMLTGMRSDDGLVHIVCAVEIVRKETTLVPVDELREGMVIGLDIRDKKGGVLLTTGTRLSAKSVELLRTHLEPIQRLPVVE